MAGGRLAPGEGPATSASASGRGGRRHHRTSSRCALLWDLRLSQICPSKSFPTFLIRDFCYQGANKANVAASGRKLFPCQLHAAAFLGSLAFLDVSNLHLNVLTNSDPIMSEMIGTVWDEMTDRRQKLPE